MTAGRRLARIALASLIVAGAGACRRKAPALKTLPEPAADFPLSVRLDAKDAAVARAEAAPPDASDPEDPFHPMPLTRRPLSPELRELVARGHAHPAVGSLEAAGCDLALVMTGADHARFYKLRMAGKYAFEMDPIAFDPRTPVVWCQAFTHPVDCAALAPIFARVARPKHQFDVYSGDNPPFNPRCVGTHDPRGKFLGGEGPGYPSKARL